ncbi:MAG: thiamine phosphate synthase [Betaproteobacteria bacterium]|nr:thiamine phosphate synthase [Betaproteobacteria bacterium]
MTAKTQAERRRQLRGLYAITPELHDSVRLVGLVRSALEGGARLVQYRAKGLAAGERALQARALLSLCRERGVPFIVNDDVELALSLAADGVHLGRDDGDPREVRRRLPDAIVGISCYDDPARAVAAAAAGADYIGIGSIFASPTKPHAILSGLAAIAEARRMTPLPVAAIGGITAANAAVTVAAGADMLAVISALFDTPDAQAAARALSRPFNMETDPHVRTQPTAL